MGRKRYVASLQHWNTVACLAFVVAVIVGHESVPSGSRFVKGFVIVGQGRRRSIQDRENHGFCFHVEQTDCSFPPLHAKAQKRYGFEVRRAKREANRQRRRDRAETIEASIHEMGKDNDSDNSDDEETTNGRTNRVVSVLKWPLQRIQNLFRS